MEPFRQIGTEFLCLEFPNQNVPKRILMSTLDEAVDDMVRQALEGEASRVILTGQSLGGTVALLAGIRLVEAGHANLLDGIVCFSPILSPQSWFSQKNYEFIDNPQQAPSAESLIRVHRRGRTAQVSRSFWESVQHTHLDDSIEWMRYMAKAKTPILIFLGLRDAQWNDAMLARIKNGIPQCEVFFETSSRHHFRGAAGERVGSRVLEWLAERAAPSLNDKGPAAVVFDWDGVLCSAKSRVDMWKALKHAFFSVATEKKGIWNEAVAPERAWEVIRQEVSKGDLHKHWRLLILRLGEIAYPKSPERRALLTIALGVSFLHEHRKLLREIHLTKAPGLTPRWGRPLLEKLAQRGIRLSISSNTIREEVAEEAKLTGLEGFFDGIFGYPVRKIEVLKSLARELGCSLSRVVLVDDSCSEVGNVCHESFSAVFMAKNDVPSEIRKMPCVRMVRGSENTSANKEILDILLQEDYVSRGIDPSELAQQFLGDEVHLIGRLLKRFGDRPIWRVWSGPKSDVVYYLKIVDLNCNEANRIARILKRLRGKGLPVAEWLPVGKDYCIALDSGQCAVMETALPGCAVSYEDQSERKLEETARMLARLHASMEEITSAEGPFRPEFPTGLGTFGQRADEVWRLLVYARHHLAYEPKHNPQLTAILRWFDEHGTAILLSFDKVRDELSATLNATSHQLVFGDFNCTNVLFSSDDSISGVIDYEDLHHGPRELDALTHCMFGTSAPHFPIKNCRFLRAYAEEAPVGLNRSAIGPIARAISHTQLIRTLRRALSSAYIQKSVPDTETLAKLDRLERLCFDLQAFEVSDDEKA
jgi:Ser/Thr protein kinase RdoA (MazF antagonist)/FMN phosphatase YigB (HAD superfamily)